ncbi:MAG: glutathione S-transferase N-terminal domain-containing protein [Proteobacteria bacterium]|nr:glutathione S-transferase N-terminal domain-containing protein [Pseudomonadota bacterium]
MFKLLSATPSPYARKVRIALAEKGLPFELVTEVPWDKTTATPKYNPLEKLPVLILEDGSGIYESHYILEWLELKYPETPLLPADVDGKLAARKLEVLCDGVCDAFVLSFFERMRPKDMQSEEWLARQQRKIEGGLREVARLIGNRAFAVGDRLTLGDIATGTMLAYLRVRYTDFDWPKQYPLLVAYSERLEQRPSFAASRPVPQKISDKVV